MASTIRRASSSKRIGAPKMGYKNEVVSVPRNINTPVSAPSKNRALSPQTTINQRGQTPKQVARTKRGK